MPPTSIPAIKASDVPVNDNGDNMLAVDTAGTIIMPKDYGNGVTDAAATVRIRGTLRHESGQPGRFVLEGEACAVIPALCSVCLTETEYRASCTVSEIFAREPADIDEWPVTDGIIDLSPAILANIITQMPMRIPCGSCSQMS